MRSTLLGKNEARASLGMIKAEHALTQPKDRLPMFLPFSLAVIDGEEVPSVWWAGSESSLITAPMTSGSFGIFESDHVRDVCEISEGILQLQRQTTLIQGTPDVKYYKDLLANTYRNVFSKQDRVPDVSQHLRLVSVGVVSREPSGSFYRACLRVRKMHCKGRDAATIVLDFSLQALQDLLDAVSAQNGPLLARGADIERSGFVCRPKILQDDL